MPKSFPCVAEMRRLKHGPKPEEPIPGIGIVTFSVSCDGNSQEVLDTAISVMEVICLQYESGWSEEAKWRSILPSQFVSACAEEMTPSESQQWLQRWQVLSQEEREAEERNRRWSLANWLYWLRPSERLWQWWDAKIVDSSHLVVRVAVESWPFGCGAINWLFRGSGAKQVTAVEE